MVILRRVRAHLLAVALAGAVLTAGCSPSGETNDGATEGPAETTTTAAPSGFYTGPEIDAEPNALGVKWSWTHTDLFDELTEVAGGATFYEVEWCDVEPTQGARDVSLVDNAVRSAGRMGYETFLKLRVGQCWASGSAENPGAGTGVKGPSSFPVDVGAYEDFVKDIVTHYGEMGVHTYAIENEVNAQNFWAGSPDQYVELVRIGAAAAHAADPQARVFDGGFDSIGYGVVLAADLLDAGRAEEALALYNGFYGRRLGSSRFPQIGTIPELRRYLANDYTTRARAFMDATFRATAYTDGFQVHFYEPYEYLNAVVAHVRGHLPKQVPLEVWEIGIAWPGNDFDAAVAGSEVANLVGTALALGIERVIYLPAAFSEETGRREVWRGLWKLDGTPLPGAPVFANMVRVTAGDNRTFAAFAAPGLTGVTVGGGDPVVVVAWATGETAHVGAPPQGATATDASGSQVDWGPAGISVGKSPVFLSVPGSDSAAAAAALAAAAS